MLGGQQEVVRALIRFAQGRRDDAKQILQVVHKQNPELRLHRESFPPQFIEIFGSIVQKPDKKATGRPRDVVFHLNADKPLSAAHWQLRRIGRQGGWPEIWAVRFVAIGWNQRIDLHRIPVSKGHAYQSVSVEMEKGASKRKVVRVLLDRLFNVDTKSQND